MRCPNKTESDIVDMADGSLQPTSRPPLSNAPDLPLSDVDFLDIDID